MSERTPAQQRWSMAITKRDMAGAAFQRAEEVGREVAGIAEQLATLQESVYHINQRLDGLESAANPAMDSDPVCATCQHPRSCHNQGGCYPTKTGVFGPLLCPCKAFVPVAEPDDPICQRPGCGHPKSWHCYESDDKHLNACSDCECESFLDTAPVTPKSIDPVLSHIASAYRVLCAEDGGLYRMAKSSLREAFRERTGDRGASVQSVHDALLAYGLTS